MRFQKFLALFALVAISDMWGSVIASSSLPAVTSTRRRASSFSSDELPAKSSSRGGAEVGIRSPLALLPRTAEGPSLERSGTSIEKNINKFRMTYTTEDGGEFVAYLVKKPDETEFQGIVYNPPNGRGKGTIKFDKNSKTRIDAFSKMDKAKLFVLCNVVASLHNSNLLGADSADLKKYADRIIGILRPEMLGTPGTMIPEVKAALKDRQIIFWGERDSKTGARITDDFVFSLGAPRISDKISKTIKSQRRDSVDAGFTENRAKLADILTFYSYLQKGLENRNSLAVLSNDLERLFPEAKDTEAGASESEEEHRESVSRSLERDVTSGPKRPKSMLRRFIDLFRRR